MTKFIDFVIDIENLSILYLYKQGNLPTNLEINTSRFIDIFL